MNSAPADFVVYSDDSQLLKNGERFTRIENMLKQSLSKYQHLENLSAEEQVEYLLNRYIRQITL